MTDHRERTRSPLNDRPLRIALVAPPLERVPPLAYGGTERVVHALATELVDRGHDVTVFASGDSDVPGRLEATVPRSLWADDFGGDAGPFFLATMNQVLDQADRFDLVHSHLEWHSLPLARLATVPVAATFHGRLDLDYAKDAFARPPAGLVAISRHQASVHPDVPFDVVYNGLDLRSSPFHARPGDGLCFVGRVDPEKGIIDAIEIAKATGRRLRIAAKIGKRPAQVDYYEQVFRPALEAAGPDVEFVGELSPRERDRLFADSEATLMPGSWPEPFGLVAIESLACGTPVLTRRVGALPEIVREGVDGWFGDDVRHLAFLSDRLADLDRSAIRASVLDRFSAARMADGYEQLYGRLVAGRRPAERKPVMVAPALARSARPSPSSGRSRVAAIGRIPESGRLPEGGRVPGSAGNGRVPGHVGG
jgi:glycosyltransferase involved in cell wall biosynthesis